MCAAFKKEKQCRGGCQGWQQHKMALHSGCDQLLDMYRKVASSNTSRLEAHAGFFRLLMKGIFNPCVL